MDYEFLHSCFPNYTLAMWQGNKPKNHTSSINGDYFDKYEDMEGKGSCQVYNGVAVSGEWSFGHYRIFISDSRQFDGKYMLHIMHNTGDDSVYWVYRNDNGICRLAYISYATKSPISQKPNYAKSLIRKINLRQNVGKCFMKRPKNCLNLATGKENIEIYERYIFY